MAVVTQPPRSVRISEEEYLRELADSNRWEFCNGVATEKRGELMTRRDHVTLAEELSAALRAYRLRAGGFAGQTPTTNLSRSDERLYRMPDLAYWAPEREIGESIFTPPTLAIELVSADQSVPGLRDKCRAYREHGVEVCWLIDPARRTAEVFEMGRDAEPLRADGVLESPALPEFRLPLPELFAALDR